MPVEREITSPVALVTPDGCLATEAIGWTRTPLHDTSGLTQLGWRHRHWGRTKRWEYWAITSPTHVVALTVSDIDYAGVNALYVLDRRTGAQMTTEVVAPLARGVTLPLGSRGGHAAYTSAKLALDIRDDPGGTRLTARSPRVRLEAYADLPPAHERLGVVVPWSRTRFQYTIKDLARPATGTLWVDGAAIDLPPGDSWATLDHGRGRWPYRIDWNWGAGSGRVDGRVVGLQLGGRWTDGTGATENALTVDGRLTKISEDLRWSYAAGDWRRPWQVRGGPVAVTFTPDHVRLASTQLGVVASRTAQCFGVWTGRVGDQCVDGLYGWAEDVRQRW
ncbi:MAG TPA: DUF2804 domain-containing protein [Phycicoccus sp.]|nr:DUF2804 domain-containing protein [Phycicoccus sp.]